MNLENVCVMAKRLRDVCTCRKDDFGKAHFDTRQCNHVEWETPVELRDKLKSRIQATITP
jgi:hypothetical protein